MSNASNLRGRPFVTREARVVCGERTKHRASSRLSTAICTAVLPHTNRLQKERKETQTNPAEKSPVEEGPFRLKDIKE